MVLGLSVTNVRGTVNQTSNLNNNVQALPEGNLKENNVFIKDLTKAEHNGETIDVAFTNLEEAIEASKQQLNVPDNIKTTQNEVIENIKDEVIENVNVLVTHLEEAIEEGQQRLNVADNINTITNEVVKLKNEVIENVVDEIIEVKDEFVKNTNAFVKSFTDAKTTGETIDVVYTHFKDAIERNKKRLERFGWFKNKKKPIK